MSERYDLIVIGGGPAGSTMAGLVKKHAPEKRVLVIEKAPGPRHHVGESLLPGIIPVLKELGVYEKIDAAGFPKKLGATFIWGADRTPWDADFTDGSVQELLERHGGIPEKINYAWQVKRSVYDEILLAHAGELGAELARGETAKRPIEEDGRIVGVVTAGADGVEVERRCDFLADCSGQDGFLSRFRDTRRYNPGLKNVAGFAYFRGAKWKFTYTGHPDKTKIFITAVEDGWFWYIPLGPDLVSVGLVSPIEKVKEQKATDFRAHFLARLRACEDLWPLVESAEMVADYEGTGKDFFTHRDWSYLSVCAAGPGWLAAGDAAVFVDPILSTGVTLAHTSGHRAAYTLINYWREADEPLRTLLLEDYTAFCRESAAQYLVLALFWYGNERNAEGWWEQAREAQRALMPVDLKDKQAFVAVAAGLLQYYDRAVFTLGPRSADSSKRQGLYELYRALEDGRLDESTPLPRSFPFFAGLGLPAPAPASDSDVPVLLCAYETGFTFLPVFGEGTLKPVKRLRFLKHPAGHDVTDAFNPRRVVVKQHLELLKAVDGRADMGEISAALLAKGVTPAWLEGPGLRFLRELELQGVLAFRRGGGHG